MTICLQMAEMFILLIFKFCLVNFILHSSDKESQEINLKKEISFKLNEGKYDGLYFFKREIIDK